MVIVSLALDGNPAPAPGTLDRLPRRLRLSRAALEHLGTLTDTPVPWRDPHEWSRTARALGPLGAPVDPDGGPDDPDGLDGLDPIAELHRARVLTGPDDVHPEVVGALAVLGSPEVLVDLDLSVRRAGAPAGFAQLRSWQRLRDGQVTTVSDAGGPVLELAWFDDDRWQSELARAVTVTRPRTSAQPPARLLDLPHELLLGSGEALRLGREDVFGELVARHTGAVRAGADATPLGRAGTDEQLRLLHAAALGRMRTVVYGLGATGARRIGWVSWLLFPDGWRSLTPYTLDHQARVRVQPVEPGRLGVEVARLVTGIRA